MTTSIHPPCFAWGKDDASTIDPASDGWAIGDLTLEVAAVTGNFAEGIPIFISDSADANIEYLGPVLSRVSGNPGTLTVKYPIARAYLAGSGAKIWSPAAANHALFDLNFNSPFILGRDTGVQTRISRGGVVYSDRYSEAVVHCEMRFNPGWREDWKRFRDFIVNTRDDGLDSFSVAYFDFSELNASDPADHGNSRVDEFRLNLRNLDFDAPNIAQSRFTIPLFRIAADTYVTA